MDDFKAQYLANLLKEEKEQLAKNQEAIESFKALFATKGIQLTDENFKYIQTIGVVAEFPNILSHLASDIVNDKDGLVKFDKLESLFAKHRFAEGYFYSTNFIIMAHPYFRRGFHDVNNFAPRFVEHFWNFNCLENEKFIALDLNRVRINIDTSVCMELDTWYGAKFIEEIALISDGVSKLRPPLDIDEFDISFFFRDAYSLDTKWYTKDHIKSFQAEEFKTEKIKILKDGVEYYPVRYVHAEFDINLNAFRHFDGAIHFYTKDEYFERRDSDFNYNSKNSNHIKTLSQKLFKINGKISVESWTNLTSHFFAGNPLIIEYYEGKYPAHIIEFLSKVRST
jgi:hypothetical protein